MGRKELDFWDEWHALREEEAEFDGFCFLENIEASRGLSAYSFLHGFCDIFAIALNEAYGYPIHELRHDGKLVHAWCEAGESYIDVRGICPKGRWDEFFEDEFAEFIEDEEKVEVLSWKDAQEMGKTYLPDMASHYCKEAMALAKKLIQKYSFYGFCQRKEEEPFT